MNFILIVTNILITIMEITDVAFLPTFIAFLVMKLCGEICWSWWVVFTPLIIGVVCLVATVLLYGYIIFIGQSCK